jgi:hypothetical protein
MTTTTFVFFNADTEELRAAEIAPTGDDWYKLPRVVGIIWDNDQSQNQMIFSDLRRANYTFDPADDLALLSEYTDQIADYFAE